MDSFVGEFNETTIYISTVAKRKQAMNKIQLQREHKTIEW